jgi:hypothetical protein
MWKIGGIVLSGKTEVRVERSVPLKIFPPQMSNVFFTDCTRFAAVSVWQFTA